MQKLKIIKESRAVRCDICHKGDYFNNQSNYCSRCNSFSNTNQKVEIMDLYRLNSIENINNDKSKQNQVNIEDLGYSYTIIYKWFSINKWLVLSIFGNLMNFLCVLIILFSSDPNKYLFQNGNIANIILIPILFIGLLATIINKTYIKIMDKKIEIETKPISFISKTIINIDQIKDIKLKNKFRQNSISLVLKNGKQTLLLQSFDDKSIKFIEVLIKKKVFNGK